MAEKDIKKLNRSQLVEILCRQREMIDDLNRNMEALQARAEEAEAKCQALAAAQEEETQRKAEDEELRADMRRVIEEMGNMRGAMLHCSEAERCIQAAQKQAEELLTQAREQAEAMVQEAEQDVARRKEAFTRQCEELVRGQEVLRRLMGNG